MHSGSGEKDENVKGLPRRLINFDQKSPIEPSFQVNLNPEYDF